MRCPKCGFLEDKVIDSRVSKEGDSVRRRRECVDCGNRFTTLEQTVPAEIYVIKSDESREEFNPQKIYEGLQKACWKRPIGDSELQAVLGSITSQLEELGEREISSEKLGKLVMDELRELDDIAYVRFASVYREFKDTNQFISEIRKLKRRK
jgi:transcriptional repressor NrdR